MLDLLSKMSNAELLQLNNETRNSMCGVHPYTLSLFYQNIRVMIHNEMRRRNLI